MLDEEKKHALPFSLDLKGLPQFFIDCGGSDFLVSEMCEFVRRLKHAKVNVKSEIWSDVGHTFETSPPEETLQIVAKAYYARRTWLQEIFGDSSFLRLAA